MDEFYLLFRSTQHLKKLAGDNTKPAGRPLGRHDTTLQTNLSYLQMRTAEAWHRPRVVERGVLTVASMAGDWGPVLIAEDFFVVMPPGLICEIPDGRARGWGLLPAAAHAGRKTRGLLGWRRESAAGGQGWRAGTGDAPGAAAVISRGKIVGCRVRPGVAAVISG